MGKDMQLRIAFIGAGRMARAMAGGIIQKGTAVPAGITCTSADDGTGEALADELGIHYTRDPAALLGAADVVVLACKPQQLSTLDPQLSAGCAGKLVLSILAGATRESLRAAFPGARNVIRAMPNTPGLIGAGVTVYAQDPELAIGDDARIRSILEALGKVYSVEEKDLDAVTAVSGSGPAYVFEMVAALRDAGIAEGLEPELAYQLSLQTVIGAGRLLEAVPESPETHRTWVSSPGGTTLAGLGVMDQSDFRGLMRQTVEAAARRSRELASGS